MTPPLPLLGMLGSGMGVGGGGKRHKLYGVLVQPLLN